MSVLDAASFALALAGIGAVARDPSHLGRFAELNRIGESWYMAKRTAFVTVTVESALTLWYAREGVSFLAFFFCGVLSVIAGAIAAVHEVTALRRRFGEVEEV